MLGITGAMSKMFVSTVCKTIEEVPNFKGLDDMIVGHLTLSLSQSNIKANV